MFRITGFALRAPEPEPTGGAPVVPVVAPTAVVAPAVAPVIAAPVAPAVAPAAPAAAPSAPAIQEDPNWLNARLQKNAEAAAAKERAKLLAELGISDVAAAKNALTAAKALEEASKSELQKANERAAALAPKADRAAALESIISERATAEMSGLTDAQKETVVGLAGEDPAQQLKTIDRLRKGGLLTVAAPAVTIAPVAEVPVVAQPAQQAPAAQTRPPGASTTGAGGGPPPASPSSPDHRRTYEALETANPMAAATYLARNQQKVYPSGNGG